MNKSEQINELATALSKAQGAIKGALKDTANPFFKSKYADLSSVWEACREQLANNGLSVAQTPCKSEHGYVGIETILMHSSGQWISNDFAIPVTKVDAQGFGSAITYARRYALAAMVGVAPEDDDGNAATGKVNKETGEIKPIKTTPNDGALENVTAEERKQARAIASNIVSFWQEGRQEEAYSEWTKDMSNEMKLAVWEVMKPNSAIRTGLKKMNAERREAA